MIPIYQKFLALFSSPAPQEGSPYDYSIELGDGEKLNLDSIRGKVVLIANTASACGFTKQYDALESVYQRYKSEGLTVIGFPSNDFMGQEPGSDSEISEFCRVRFGVTFPLVKKAPVTGADIHPFFAFLTTKSPGPYRGRILWNFEKFLIGRSGEVVARWRSPTAPNSQKVIRAIESELKR